MPREGGRTSSLGLVPSCPRWARLREESSSIYYRVIALSCDSSDIVGALVMMLRSGGGGSWTGAIVSTYTMLFVRVGGMKYLIESRKVQILISCIKPGITLLVVSYNVCHEK